jgi:hypothetical protein
MDAILPLLRSTDQQQNHTPEIAHIASMDRYPCRDTSGALIRNPCTLYGLAILPPFTGHFPLWRQK